LRQKRFFVRISASIAARWLRQHIKYSLHIRYNKCKFGSYRSVTKGTLPLMPKEIFPLSRLAKDWKMARGIPCSCAKERQVWSKSIGKEGHFTLEGEMFFRLYTPGIAAGWLGQYIMRHKHWKFVRNRSVTKGNLLLRPKHFFVPIWPSVAGRCLRKNMWPSMSTRYMQCKFEWDRSVTKGTLTL
jgi:hypothetical protein